MEGLARGRCTRRSFLPLLGAIQWRAPFAVVWRAPRHPGRRAGDARDSNSHETHFGLSGLQGRSRGSLEQAEGSLPDEVNHLGLGGFVARICRGLGVLLGQGSGDKAHGFAYRCSMASPRQNLEVGRGDPGSIRCGGDAGSGDEVFVARAHLFPNRLHGERSVQGPRFFGAVPVVFYLPPLLGWSAWGRTTLVQLFLWLGRGGAPRIVKLLIRVWWQRPGGKRGLRIHRRAASNGVGEFGLRAGPLCAFVMSIRVALHTHLSPHPPPPPPLRSAVRSISVVELSPAACTRCCSVLLLFVTCFLRCADGVPKWLSVLFF